MRGPVMVAVHSSRSVCMWLCERVCDWGGGGGGGGRGIQYSYFIACVHNFTSQPTVYLSHFCLWFSAIHATRLTECPFR